MFNIKAGQKGVLNPKIRNENVYRICDDIETSLVNRGECSNLSSARNVMVQTFCEAVCAKRSE